MKTFRAEQTAEEKEIYRKEAKERMEKLRTEKIVK